MTQSSRPLGVVVLGSTGSIGVSTLDVVAAHPERLHLVGIAASRNHETLQRQIDTFKPRYAACGAHNGSLRDVTIVDGPSVSQLSTLATLDEADIVVVATSGHDAITPTLDALHAGKIVALANKETVVAAGHLVMELARRNPGALRPVDSEHSAIWQCLMSSDGDVRRVHRIVLTASGGPFRGWTPQQLRSVTPKRALQHPNWEMGPKITIDSATLMNKGLEVIEAHWLFDIELDRIDVVVHPQSIVHSCVEFVDGSIIAQLGSHDMRLPIQFALTYPDRLPSPAPRLSMRDITRLDFEPPDEKTFPLLRLSREAARWGKTFPAVLSVADSVAVDAFLREQIRFDQIAEVVERTLDRHRPDDAHDSVEGIHAACAWAERESQQIVAHVDPTG